MRHVDHEAAMERLLQVANLGKHDAIKCGGGSTGWIVVRLQVPEKSDGAVSLRGRYGEDEDHLEIVLGREECLGLALFLAEVVLVNQELMV